MAHKVSDLIKIHTSFSSNLERTIYRQSQQETPSRRWRMIFYWFSPHGPIQTGEVEMKIKNSPFKKCKFLASEQGNWNRLRHQNGNVKKGSQTSLCGAT